MVRKRKKKLKSSPSHREEYIRKTKIETLESLGMPITEENMKKVTICTGFETMN